MKKINIGILGCGTVGTGVCKLLIEKKKLIKSRTGVILNLKHVADIDIKKERGINFKKGVLIKDAETIINDPEIDIIVELIGGKDTARDFTLKAFENGKHVVTANKALIASFGSELIEIAYKNHVDFTFEASCGGCMPVIKTLRESMVGNTIKSMTGILNGTCNYILTKMSKENCSFEKALNQAQEKGFAESDPFLDIEGFDSAHKLAILISLAYGMEIALDDIYVQGITKISPMDIQFAKEFGYAIKLLAISKNYENNVEARIHPAMIPLSNPLSHIDGSMNAVVINGHATGETMLYGHGAGMMPTASAVISDIVDIARNIITKNKTRIPILGYFQENIKKIPVLSIKEINASYYFRFAAADNPGVLSKISGILGDHNISIKIVHQKGRNINGSVPVVIITHLAKEENIQKALKIISKLNSIIDKPVVIRIEEDKEI